jgi:hypothetical protein
MKGECAGFRRKQQNSKMLSKPAEANNLTEIEQGTSRFNDCEDYGVTTSTKTC